MTRMEKRKLERVQYWQGQRLRSGDFLDIEAVEAQRRWWHNRALHNAYGVAEGFACSLVPSTAPFTGVCVSPGVGYDTFGRELILERAQTIPLPSNIIFGLDGAVSLLIRYRAPSRAMHPDEFSEVCWTQSGSLEPGTIEFAWKLTSNFKPSDGVSLFGVYYRGAIPVFPDPNYIRATIQPLARPLLASGSTIPGNTAWEPWEFMSQGALGVQTPIDTSAAGFSSVPCYFAWLEGPVWNAQTLQLVPAIFPSIADESVTGFTFRLWLEFPQPTFGIDTVEEALPRELAPAAGFGFVTDPDDFPLFAQQQELYVSWIACQMPVSVSCCATQQESGAGAAQASGGPQIT